VTNHRQPSAGFIETHGAKIMRYCGVSVINVINGQAVFVLCLEVLSLRPVVSTFIAAVTSAIPAYFLSRRWVWQQSGPDSMKAEVLPFWAMTLAGLIFALSMVAIAEQVTDSTLLLMATNVSSYGIVWVFKYVVLDRLMWHTPTATVVAPAMEES